MECLSSSFPCSSILPHKLRVNNKVDYVTWNTLRTQRKSLVCSYHGAEHWEKGNWKTGRSFELLSNTRGSVHFMVVVWVRCFQFMLFFQNRFYECNRVELWIVVERKERIVAGSSGQKKRMNVWTVNVSILTYHGWMHVYSLPHYQIFMWCTAVNALVRLKCRKRMYLYKYITWFYGKCLI